jgi:hypothetical protein
MEELMKELEIALNKKHKFKGIYEIDSKIERKIENFVRMNYHTYYSDGALTIGTERYREHGFLGVKSIYVYVKITKDDKIKVIIKSDKFLMM